MKVVTIPPSITDQELRNLYLLAGLTDEQLAQMREYMRYLQLKEGDLLFEQEQTAERFFVVVKGHIKLIRFSLEGDEKVIEIISPGQAFAEAIMFRPRQIYPVTAQAVGMTEVLSFNNRIFLEILEHSFETCKRILCDMSMRLHIWLNEIDHLTLQNATYRLVNYLLNQVPHQHSGLECEVHFDIPKQVVASRISVKPETFSRILHQMTEQGLVTVSGRIIKIHNIDKLRLYGQNF